MSAGSPVLRALARLYAESKAGRTGAGQRDFLVDFKKLLAAGGCEDGDDRETALRQLRAQDGKLLTLEGPRRDADIIHQVRFPVSNEPGLFALLGEPSPTERRRRLARQFADAARFEAPRRWSEDWKKLCGELQDAATQGGPVAPFSRDDEALNSELLALAPRLLAWRERGDESLLRFASCVLTGNSKRLGELAAEDEDGNRGGKLGAILQRVTGGEIRALEDVGILQAPRFALVHGPLRLGFDGESLNLGQLHGPVRLSETDINRASRAETTARRCVTVENETSFHELAKLQSGELLVCTSYPGSGTLALLKKLPASLEFSHFGDSDPEGFDILRVLRERTGRPVQALRMKYRRGRGRTRLNEQGRALVQRLLNSPVMESEREPLKRMLEAGDLGDFEQESLGVPTQREWPFYPAEEMLP
jgi:hypothetical protein